MASASANDLHLVPLGAGDLIDRAVRLYRRHLLTLMRIAAPPVVVSAIGWVMWTIGIREVANTPSTGALVSYVLLLIGAIGVILTGKLLSLIVMGGASRNLVMHLLWNEPVLARTTYAAVKSRFWGLLGASVLVMFWLIAASFLGFVGAELIVAIMAVMIFSISSFAPGWLLFILGAIGTMVVIVVFCWLFFFMVGKVAYIPQVLLVEGKGVFESLSRSFALAKGNA